MNGGPSGFHNAPVTRTFVIASALLTILFGAQGRSPRLGLSSQDIIPKFRLWRFIPSVFAFSSTPELMFGLYLLYYFRVFERQIGSNKHSIFILFSLIVSSVFEILALVYLKDPSLNTLVSGPYGLIFAAFVPFYFDIPVSSRFRIFGLNFTDKSFIYLAGLQLLFSSWKRSIVPGICGILAGSLYRLNAFGIRKMKFPDIVTSFFSRLSWPSSSSSSQTLSSGNSIGNIPSYPSRHMEGNYPSAARTSVAEASETSVATLVSMGFDSNSARQALIHAGNDINVATNILLEAQSQ
ncbi:rhomboid-like protein 20 [Elaeis guineensis]|uniref:Rhomboid-like protein 20 n=1 Tax=Elaeis guineensis var. tenera TaxID=51953 RepID=A0A6I9REL4_ELAGV|nr:rhomboid-like protein 20 [Elaeis guineensis]